jgi:hypothetical protein
MDDLNEYAQVEELYIYLIESRVADRGLISQKLLFVDVDASWKVSQD